MEPAPPEESQQRERRGKTAGGIGTILAAIAAFALKFKVILVVLLQAWTPLLTLWLYVLAFGWRFGLVLVLMILGHELGHYFAFKAYGLPVRLPVFVPFLGAFTAGAKPKDPEHGAYIALAGPLAGFALAAACYGAGLALQNHFWMACAAFGALMNLFNMIPFRPLDGGGILSGLRVPRIGARLSIGFFYAATAAGLAVVAWQAYGIVGSLAAR